MPIIRPMPPAPAAAAFADGLLAFLAGPNFGTAKLVSQAFVGAPPLVPSAASIQLPTGGINVNAIDQYLPERIFSLGLKDAANNGPVAAANPACWRFFAGSLHTQMVLARVAQRTPSASWKMTAAYYGTRVSDAFAASTALDALPQVQNQNFELRVLAVPGLNVEAFWLAAQTPGTADLVVPFPSGSLQPYKVLQDLYPYRLAAFRSILVPMALARLAEPATHGR